MLKITVMAFENVDDKRIENKASAQFASHTEDIAPYAVSLPMQTLQQKTETWNMKLYVTAWQKLFAEYQSGNS